MCASDGLRCILYLEIYANEYYGNFLLSSGLPQAGETPPGNEILWRLSLPAEVRLNFILAQGNFFFFERIFEDSSGDCDFRKLSGNSHIISFTRQYFFRLSSFFSHKLFTNIQYDRNIKRTKNYFFDRFFSYFPLLEPLNRRFFFSIRKVKAYMWWIIT